MKKIVLSMLFLWAATAAVTGQQHKVTGGVVDTEGIPVIGATVVCGATGTTTNAQGIYTIECPADASLTFTFMGFDTQTVPVQGRTTVNVTMNSSAFQIDDVVAIGYGTMKRRDLTSSVSSISEKELADVPVANVAQALAGRIAGLQITEATGAPDASISIRVRGGMSITQDNSPLYVIDGFPSEDMNGINPSDIQTIDVLKDASATAIYGARGANGIIIITTKKGAPDKVRVNYDMFYGVKKISNSIPVLNARDYAYLEYERSLPGGTSGKMESFVNNFGFFDEIDYYYSRPNHTGINWQDEVFGSNPTTQQHRFSVTGGSATSNYTISYTRNDDQGLLINSGLKRDSYRGKFNFVANKRLTLEAQVNYTDQITNGMGSLETGGRFGKLRNILIYRPTGGRKYNDTDFLNMPEDPIYEETGTNDNILQNPIVNALAELIARRNRTLSANVNATYTIFKGLKYSGMVGMRTRDSSTDTFYTKDASSSKRSGGPFGNIAQSFNSVFSFNNTLTYSHLFACGHDVTVMVGQEAVVDKTRSTRLSSANFPEYNFGTDDMSLGTTPGNPASGRQQAQIASFFGRANYSFKGRYMATVSMRADGSSKFAKGNYWGYFPSASAAWRISEESFMQNLRPVSNLKLRFSMGTSGNCRISNYLSKSTFNSNFGISDNTPNPVYYGSNMANTNLVWESNQTTNIGLDVGLLKNRIALTIEAYDMRTRDLLLDDPVPYSTGYGNVMRNIGSTRNRGLEFTLQTININKKEFKWNSSLTVSMNRNKVLALAESDLIEYNSGWMAEFGDTDYLVCVGQPLGLMYGYRYDGIYTVDDFTYAGGSWTLKDGIAKNGTPSPGDRKYKNIDGSADNMITEQDCEVIGNANPKFYGGLNNTLTYKGFDLSVYVNFSYGNDVYNANAMLLSRINTANANTFQRFFDNRFVTMDAQGNSLMTNPEALAAANRNASSASLLGSMEYRLSDLFIEDGSFLRINNVVLGYTVPKKWVSKVGIQKLRLSATVNNIYTWTKYTGYDPEVNVQLQHKALTPGIDWGAYPRASSVVFGLNLTF